ncbi:NAD(P)H-dependent oxidoreductase [Mucilaginibacter corticis]|uniref:NAD(P)H-dependent oxidoreductase n=1 Tax=Mucilaginibacter corticis TaxID=2597670 RepID=A0A556ML87_9SPHI|nr:NAD(P)H-dependent oxidoreductase [Mucilaginibacter corticis]TSJ40608.1 NAD(P)H-dependent oxidoreductase [Mucilaginibacter corticis]
MAITIAAFSGSLRKDSFTTKLIKAFKELAPEDVTVDIIDISQLPLINQDLEINLPQAVKQLHNSIEQADAVLLATPEYNRSYSPVLKNALDWGSRPEGQSKWKSKPVAVLGCTPYQLGAFGAVHHLRQVLTYLDMPAMQQPEFYLGKASDKFNGEGKLTDQETKDLIIQFWDAYIIWINKIN